MKKTLIALSLLLWGSLALGQPVGKLYLQHQDANPVLASITYPGAIYQVIDSQSTTDLVIGGDLLFAAAAYPTDSLYVYDRNSHQRMQTLAGIQAQGLDMWEGKLVACSWQAPYLRVYDPQQGYAESFTVLDSLAPAIAGAPQDMLVAGDRAYVLFARHLAVIDLDLEDTLAIVETPHPYPGAGQNRGLCESGNALFISVEYATGALRSSLLRVDKLTLQVDTAFHQEGQAGFFPPLAVGDSIMLYEFPSHYRISADSLFPFSSPSQYMSYALAFDAQSNSIFTYGGVLALTELSYYWQGQSREAVQIRGLRYARFWAENSTSLAALSPAPDIKLFPNPTPDFLYFQWPEAIRLRSLRIIDSQGKLCWQQAVDPRHPPLRLDLRDLGQGGYFMEMGYGKGKTFTQAFVKWDR
jgi:hypothetical protein